MLINKLVITLFLLPMTALALDLTNLHDKETVIKGDARYQCFVSHEHSGVGKHTHSKKLALREAASAWQSFTVWEYGKTWGMWKNATDKRIRCSYGQDVFASDSGSTEWRCEVFAKACRKLN